MAGLCDFVTELGTENSHWRNRWKNATKTECVQVAKDYGLSEKDVNTVRKVLQSGDTTPIRDACGKQGEGAWVRK